MKFKPEDFIKHNIVNRVLCSDCGIELVDEWKEKK